MLLQMAKLHSFLWLSNIPLCVCVCVCVCVYYIFFNHSSVDGHLGCVYILAIINNAPVKLGVHVCFQIMFFGFGGYIPQSEIPGSYSLPWWLSL